MLEAVEVEAARISDRALYFPPILFVVARVQLLKFDF
jgi:hypothetical protein